jgi:glycosyltransferase involved in cell wall biosynthesis
MTTNHNKTEKVTVVIPCYNEAKGIGDVIAKFPHSIMQSEGVELEVLVVDNNSTDHTADVARAAGARVIHESEKGKGNAMRTGFKNVSDDSDYVIMLDGDDTYHPGEIMRLLEPIRSGFSDVVVGSRLCGSIQSDAMNRLNYIGNKLFTFLARLLYGSKVTDVLTGYFAWRKEAIDELAPQIKSSGFAIEMEMVIKMARLGHRMTSVPISYLHRAGDSHLRPVRDGLRILWVALKHLLWQPKNFQRRLFIPRKIVFVSDAVYPYMKGGKEKRLHEITKHLAQLGHDVHIYTMHWWAEPTTTKREEGVTLHSLCKLHPLYHGNKRAIKEAVMFSLACLKLLRVKFDIIDVDHMPFFPVFTTWAICRLRGRKLHATWHEALSRQEWVSYMNQAGILAWFIEWMSIRLPHRITAASAQTKESLAAIHGRDKGVAMVGSGIDVSLLNSVPAAPVQCDALYVGRLVKDKNVDKLVEAMRVLTQTHPAARCIIIGEGPEKASLQKLIAKYKLKSNVTLMGSLPEARDVYGYMKAARVFCSPSVREGFGIVTLEALGCGTPVITSNSRGNAARHLITNGQNGSIVSLAPAAIADAIEYWMSVAEKPDTARQVASNDWRVLAQQQAEAYML